MGCIVVDNGGRLMLLVTVVWQKIVSDVGFEPTSSSEDQNSHLSSVPQSKVNLESGALDHSANLTC